MLGLHGLRSWSAQKYLCWGLCRSQLSFSYETWGVIPWQRSREGASRQHPGPQLLLQLPEALQGCGSLRHRCVFCQLLVDELQSRSMQVVAGCQRIAPQLAKAHGYRHHLEVDQMDQPHWSCEYPWTAGRYAPGSMERLSTLLKHQARRICQSKQVLGYDVWQ